MNEVTTFLACLHPFINNATFRQLDHISQAMLTMTGRITMLGISRWVEEGCSYRTIQRFFHNNIPWDSLNWALVKPSLNKQSVILIAGDATTVTKSGKETFGLGKFFSSIYSRAIPGISFQCLSLIDVVSRKSWPILMEQIAPKEKETEQEKEILSSKEGECKQSKGRPKGAKNKNRRDVELNNEMKQVQSMLRKLIKLTGKHILHVYFVYDGAFGNNAAVQMTRGVNLHLISKLRNDSALYFTWTGEYSGKGKPKKYGDRVDYQNLPEEHLKSEETENNVHTSIYQFKALHKKFADPVNVVIILKNNLKTGKQARIILFSSDLDLGWENLIEYYRLRFQIEFNFRDAKQHWGLEDFMVIKEQAVCNAANISMWMVNLSQAMLASSNEESILDLKARQHGLRYAREVFKMLPKNLQVININDALQRLSAIGRIHDEKIAA